ncbi:MAG: B12-binding domain-containing radical SAM protein [Elusimicrobia bacterium]|nr:B12-binding domain-containing radical SAM protein [Elusimicrobiota bacterium]
MSRILLVRPAIVFSASSYSAPVTMPIGLAYMAACLLKAGHRVDCIDALGSAIDRIRTSYHPGVRYRGLSNDEIVSRVRETPDAIGVTAMFSQDWPHIRDLVVRLKARCPGVPIIVGGEHPTALPEHVLQTCPQADFVAMGEGEGTILDFAEHLEGRRALDSVAGIAYRAGGGVVKTPARARFRDLSEIPWPAWELFDLEAYFRVGEGHGVERGRSMPILATRGCPYQCTFCSNPVMWTTRYVMRDVGDVVDEIESYADRYKVENIDFYDLTAIVKKDWVVAFCRELRRRGRRIAWQLPSGTRSEAIDDEVLGLMSSTGCMNMTYAPESGSVRTLELIKKKVKLPRLYDSIRAAKRRGIFVKCNLILGFPDETRVDLWKTVWAAVWFAFIGVDDTGLYPFSPYPGSELFERLRREGRIRELDEAYFAGLMSIMGVGHSTHFCAAVGPAEIGFYRLAGMGAFYFLSYALRPWRVLRSLRNFRDGRSDTVFEERLSALLRRWRLEKRPA